MSITAPVLLRHLRAEQDLSRASQERRRVHDGIGADGGDHRLSGAHTRTPPPFRLSRVELLELLKEHPMLQPDPRYMSFVECEDAIRYTLRVIKHDIYDHASSAKLNKFKLLSGLHHLDSAQRLASFPQYQRLPPELQDMIWENVSTRPLSDPTSHTATLGVTKELHIEAKKVFHGHPHRDNGNTLTILLYSCVSRYRRFWLPVSGSGPNTGQQIFPRILQCDGFYISAWVYVGEEAVQGPTSKLVARFNATHMDLADLVDAWPRFVSKAANINPAIRICARGATRQNPYVFLDEHPYPHMNHAIYSLAYVANACKKLKVKVEIQPGSIDDDTSQDLVLRPLCFFGNVRNFSMTGWSETKTQAYEQMVRDTEKSDEPPMYFRGTGEEWDYAFPYYRHMRGLLKIAAATNYFPKPMQAELDRVLPILRKELLHGPGYPSLRATYVPFATSSRQKELMRWMRGAIFPTHVDRVCRRYALAVQEGRIGGSHHGRVRKEDSAHV